MSDAFLGEIKLISWNYPPRYWAFCDGAVLPTGANQALYSLLGNAYGGTSPNTFALPDLRSRTPMGVEGGTPGGTQGIGAYSLAATEVAQHTHQVSPAAVAGSTGTFTAGVFLGGVAAAYVKKPASGNTSLHPATISTVGTALAHENRQPFLAINFVIALAGIYPSKN